MAKEKTEVQKVPTDTLPMSTVNAQLHNDWKGVSDSDKVKYSLAICKTLNIPTPMNPFKFISMNGKEVLYATKEAAELLAERNKISVTITNKYVERDSNLYVVEVRASMPGGRTFDNLAALSLAGKTGDIRANLMMKCVSKAIRRLVFSAVGLSVLDEDDLEAIRRNGSPSSETHPPAQVTLPPIVVHQGDPETLSESISARSALIRELCGGKGSPFFKNPANAKDWILETISKPLELLTPDDCQDVMAHLYANEEEEAEVESQEETKDAEAEADESQLTLDEKLPPLPEEKGKK